MGLFKKKKGEKDNPKDAVLKTELQSKIGGLQTEFDEKQAELADITKKITTVKKEYDSMVGNLMLVKKELNQKKMELDIIKKEHAHTAEKKRESELIKGKKTMVEFEKTRGAHTKMKEEMDEFTKKCNEIKTEIKEGQTVLLGITKQQVEVKKELEEANSRLYNSKQELDKKDTFEDTSILTQSEKEFIGADKKDQKSSAGIIEAASVVVGSLKSKLNIVQKELYTVQTLLEQERNDHTITKNELEKTRQGKQS